MKDKTLELSTDDLFNLRDACIHAEKHTQDDERRPEYKALFDKLGRIIESRRIKL